MDRAHLESRTLGQQPQLPWCVTGGPQVGLGRSPRLGTNLGALVIDPRGGIEAVSILQVGHLEVGRERREGEPTARAEGATNAVEHGKIGLQQLGIGGIDGRSTQPERPLAQRDRCVEHTVKLEGPSVGPLEGCTVGRVGRGHLDEALRNVHPGHVDATPGELVAVAARSTADVEQRHPRLQAEQDDQRVHLPNRALRKRIAQVGGAEVVGQPFKPVSVALVSGLIGGLWGDRHQPQQ